MEIDSNAEASVRLCEPGNVYLCVKKTINFNLFLDNY